MKKKAKCRKTRVKVAGGGVIRVDGASLPYESWAPEFIAFIATVAFGGLLVIAGLFMKISDADHSAERSAVAAMGQRELQKSFREADQVIAAAHRTLRLSKAVHVNRCGPVYVRAHDGSTCRDCKDAAGPFSECAGRGR